LCGVAALVHIYIFYLESIAWTGKTARAVFGIKTVEEAETMKLLAFNQGFYNLFLAVEIAFGTVLLVTGMGAVGRALVYVGAGSMVAASLVLVLSSPDKSAAALKQGLLPLLGILSLLGGCTPKGTAPKGTADKAQAEASAPAPSGRFLSAPLITSLYTADPSAHVWGGKLYIYPSHDIEAGVQADDLGSHFDMRDYHVLALDSIAGQARDLGVALDIGSVPWAKRQMWAPDAAEKDGKYYLYFPAKDRQDIFRIGVAVSERPEGPFKADPEPIPGSFSIDPAVFHDTGGAYYLYFGGIWGGQLQRWRSGNYRPDDEAQPGPGEPALTPKVARLSADLRSFSEPVRDVLIVDEAGKPLLSGDTGRRFFEASFLHLYQGTYYFSYSTGDTHFIVYATGKSPYGPFSYRGHLLEPVLGWTNHHSIAMYQGKWYLFYHDAELSGGQTHLRNVKVIELHHEADGSIRTIDAYRD
jgi:uncharacterized membrane protein